MSLVGLLTLVLYGCGPTPFVAPGVEQSPEVPEGLEIELEPIINLELAQSKGPTKYIPTDTGIGTWDPVNRIYTLTTDVNETIYIDDDNLTLDGAGHEITGSETGYGVRLYNRSNVTIKNCVVSGFWTGIFLCVNSDSNTLTSNTTYNNYYGILLYYYSSSNTLTDNTVNNNSYGIYLSSSSSNTLNSNKANDNNCGIYISGNSNYNTLNDNTANNNNNLGIRISVNSDSNTLTSNTVNYNRCGIELYLSSYNTLSTNTVNNNQYGIHFHNSSSNQIYNNNFINNLTQAYAYGGSGNIFNLDKLVGGGNYWSDWTSPDVDYDGFVDNPYGFDGEQDDFPWVCQDGWKPTGATGYLITIVEDFELPKGVEKSLIALLEVVINALENQHEQAAIGQLTGFISHVEAQNGKKLTEEQAQTLIAAAQRIIVSIQ